MKPPRHILAIDVGGSHVKVRRSGKDEVRRFDSGPKMRPSQMVSGVKKLIADWEVEAISVGYPGLVRHGRIAADPVNLGSGWIGFDFEGAFGLPAKVVNDAAMQALGSYEGGRMLFLGLGTGLGSTMILDGVMAPMELGHLPYRKGRSFEDYVGAAGLERLGKAKWRKHVWRVVRMLSAALEPDTVVLGGGNAKRLRKLMPGVRLGQNANAFDGGFRLWAEKH